MEELKLLGELASGLTVTAILLYGLWAVITGKVKTEGHHKEVIDQHVKSEERAWEMVDKTNDALAANNAVLEKFAESFGGLKQAVDALRSTIEQQRSRR